MGATAAGQLLSASPVSAARSNTLRLLVVTGGHSLDRSFFSLFEAQPGWKWQHREHAPKSTATVYRQPLAAEFDAVVLYDMPKQIAQEEQQNFLALFDQGVGVVFLHHALCALQDWPRYNEINGMRLKEKMDDGGLPKFIYKHDVHFDLQKVDAAHPVLEGVPSFRVFDETYGHVYYHENLQPLLVTAHPTSMSIVAWARRYRNSKVVAIQPGHGPQIFGNPHYRRLVANAVNWVAKA